MSNIFKRDISQPHNFEWNQGQGRKKIEEGESIDMVDDSCYLKASIWNKPDEDPRYVLRMGTSKIRCHSEEINTKTIEDEEKEKKQFAQYLQEVERRFKKSKIKEYNFLKFQKLNKIRIKKKKYLSAMKRKYKKRTIKSRNQ